MALGTHSLTINGSATDLPVTVAGTVVCTAITGISSAVGMAVLLRLAYGSGGTTIRVYLQTSLDGGTTYMDIACVLFGAAAKAVVLNFSSLTPKTTQVVPTDGTLADDTAIDGIIGDRLRLKVVSTGLYTGSTVLTGRAVVR